MNTLVLATRNEDKIAELAHALLGLPVRVISVGDLGDWPEVEETGDTLEANALLKVRAAVERTGLPCLADDTGLEVDALGGAPGVRSSRYAGEGVSYAENVARLLREMRGIEEPARTARFRCVVALADPGGGSAGEGTVRRGTDSTANPRSVSKRERLVEGVVEGRILTVRRGEGGFGYDPVFWVPEAGKTYAEMDLGEKQRWSHRGRAMREARRVIEEWFGGPENTEEIGER